MEDKKRAHRGSICYVRRTKMGDILMKSENDHTNGVPCVSVVYTRDGSSTRPNELGMRPMQERA